MIRRRQRSESGYERAEVSRLHDEPRAVLLSANRLWFFAGYQHLRDYDSQPGSDPTFPRTYEQDKVVRRSSPGSSLRAGSWFRASTTSSGSIPIRPRPSTPFEATLRRSASVPAITFGHLTHTSVAQHGLGRAGRTLRLLTGQRRRAPATSTTPQPARQRDRMSRAARRHNFGEREHHSHDRQGDPQPLPARAGWARITKWKIGGQVERGGHHATNHHSDRCEVRRQQRTARHSRSRAIPRTPAACSSPPRHSRATRSPSANG